MACCFLFKFTSFKVYWTLFSFMLVENNVTGMLTLFPMTVASVCRVGEQLQVMCTAPVQSIRWKVSRVNEQGTLEEVTNSVLIDSSDDNQRKERLVTSSVFTFTRTSARGATSPLVSTLSIDSVSISFNGTVIHCSDVANPMISASTTIRIANISQIIIEYTPTLSILNQHYGSDNVTVTLKWTQQEGAMYDVRISPLAPVLITNGNTSCQIMVLYNTEYNLTVVAVTACGNAATSMRLNYVNCGSAEQILITNNDSVTSNYSVAIPVPTISAECSDSVQLEGCSITFSCPPGWEVNGPNSATCTGNGEWEPDPTGLMCTGIDPNAQLTRQIIGIIVPIVVVLSIIAVVIIAVLHKKGYRVRKQHTQSAKGLRISLTNKYSMDKGHQNQQGRFVYADLDYDNPSEVNRKKPTGDPAIPSNDVEYSLVNYNLNICYEDSHLEGQQKRDDSLDVTLNRLVVLLREKVGPKWRDLGEAIDIDDVVLDSIAKTCFPENCIVEVLDYWLKYTDERITWREVAYVLKSINFHELALDVVQIYKTDKFPKAANIRANKEPLTEKEQDISPADLKKGSVADSSTHQKPPKTPLPLPSKK